MTSRSKPGTGSSEDFITVRINRGTLRAVVTKIRSMALAIGWLLGVTASILAVGAYVGLVR